MKHLTHISILFVSLLLVGTNLYAQEEQEEQERDQRPVRSPFESSLLLDNQTVIVPTEGTMQFEIQHRFGTLENGLSDFFGMWAPSNIRLALGYVPKEDIMIGLGATKFNQFVDLNYKWNFIKQTRSWSMPVGLTLYGYVAMDTRGTDKAPEFDENSAFRLSYFNELIIATRINSDLSVQLIPSFTHFNAVDSTYNNDTFAVTFSGRYKLTPQTSIIFEYDHPFTKHDAFITNDDGLMYRLPLDNFSFGVEISTSTHAFQIFFANYQEIMYHKNIAYNKNDSRQLEFLLGFNITRLWNF